MDYKKAYEEDLERAKKAVKEGMVSQSFVDDIFGVNQSEDERIRKWLIEEIKATHDYDSPTSRKCVDDALAYLERQKEQKDYRKLYENIAQSKWFKKAHVGKSLGEEFEQKEQTGKKWIYEDDYKSQLDAQYQQGLEDGRNEQKPAEWSDNERIRKALVDYFTSRLDASKLKDFPFSDIIAYLERQKDSDKAMSAIEKIDKYIDSHTANAHDMDDSNPDKKYYSGVDDTLSDISGILINAYSEEKQKEQPAAWSEEDEEMLQ